MLLMNMDETRKPVTRRVNAAVGHVNSVTCKSCRQICMCIDWSQRLHIK